MFAQQREEKTDTPKYKIQFAEAAENTFDIDDIPVINL